MSTCWVAKVAVEGTAYHFDKAYDYLLPPELQGRVGAGCRVLVPFGGGNRTRQGIVVAILEEEEGSKKRKKIRSLLDPEPLLSVEMIQLALWMKKRYFCTLFDIFRVMLPAGIHYRVEASYRINPDISPAQLQALPLDAMQVVQYLSRQREAVSGRKLQEKFHFSPEEEFLEKLTKQGILLQEKDAMRRMKDAAIRMARMTEQGRDYTGKLTSKQQEVLSILCREDGVSVKEICYYTGVTTAVVQGLVKKGLVEYFDQERFRMPGIAQEKQKAPLADICLTSEQQKAYEELLASYHSGKEKVSLLYGVTGSGKTSVFFKLIETASREGKGVIVMVPEISLTPQMVSIFRRRFGDQVAVFHSGLSMGERMDEWKRVKLKKASIVVGTRSAIFAPLDNVGLIIMDEEQEYTYKSENAPRFHARDVAKFRCQFHHCLLLLASATPSLESFYAACSGRYQLHRLSTRYGKARLPEVVVADMNQEIEEGNTSSFSSILLDCLEENLRLGRQSILLLNRRGYHTFVSCRSCMEVLTCPHCSISMTYHAANHRLMCHYCGYSVEFTDECPVCHQKKLRYTGMGTQRAQQELETFFPEARILRMDTDTTMAKDSHKTKLAQFARGEYDIMLGTQMVAKGLDFPNVTLVGVPSADQSLYSDDFRSYERTFSLLTQVVGRSGRGTQAGKAVIQTFTPENPIIRMAPAQDYEAFYQSEIVMRKSMLYPPFVDLCVLGFSGTQEEKTSRASQNFFQRLKELAQTEYSGLPLRVLGPSSASIAKVSNKYRYRIIIKHRNCQQFRDMMSQLLVEYGKQKEYGDVSVFVDVNPDRIL